MASLTLDVRIDGFDEPVGVLARDENGAVAFEYTSRHLAQPQAMALSLSMPLTDEPYGDVAARAFFDNLLQERDADLASIMAREGLPRDDIAGLLYHLGKDCAGAVSVLPRGAPPVKVPGDYDRDYVRIPDDRLQAIVAALHRRQRLPDGTADPSPLAGMQSKIALTRLPDGTFAEPIVGSGAPTTHILKVPDQDHLQDAALESTALELSRSAGFETADAMAMVFAGVPALLITRFDRARDAQGRIIRLHQEDFAQALGLAPSLKYERRGAPGRRFDVNAVRRVLDATADPAFETDKFIRLTIFDLLIGNADGHAKNFSLLYDSGMRPRLAPRYDVLPTRLDPGLTDELAYRIGDAAVLEDITAQNFDDFLAALGIGKAVARRRIRMQYTSSVTASLALQLARLSPVSKRFADMIASNIRILSAAFGLDAPEAAQQRDTFTARAGGWLLPS